jgi:hypothetical protein
VHPGSLMRPPRAPIRGLSWLGLVTTDRGLPALPGATEQREGLRRAGQGGCSQGAFYTKEMVLNNDRRHATVGNTD